MRGSHVRVRKELSVCFTVDTVITSHEIIVGLDQAGIDVDDITSIQRRVSNNSWVVTFGSKAVKDATLNEQSIKIAGISVLLGDCENRVSIIKVYELPDELPDSVVIGRLSNYGRVISFRRDRMADAIFNASIANGPAIGRSNASYRRYVACASQTATRLPLALLFITVPTSPEQSLQRLQRSPTLALHKAER